MIDNCQVNSTRKKRRARKSRLPSKGQKRCSLCLQQATQVKLSCASQICRSCLLEYAINNARIQKRGKEYQVMLNCPFQHPRLHSIANQVQSLLLREQKLLYSDALTQKLLNKHPSVIPCSNGTCRMKFFCQDDYFACDLHCTQCNYLVFKKTNYFAYLSQTLRSEMSKAFFTTSCPNCQAAVYRISGCNHIRCACSAQFCYHCGHFWNMHGTCSISPQLVNASLIACLFPIFLGLISISAWRVFSLYLLKGSIIIGISAVTAIPLALLAKGKIILFLALTLVESIAIDYVPQEYSQTYVIMQGWVSLLLSTVLFLGMLFNSFTGKRMINI